MNRRIAEINIDPFGEPESRPEEPMDENISLDLVTPNGGSTWEPKHEHETSFGGKALESFIKSLYKRLSGSDDEPWE